MSKLLFALPNNGSGLDGYTTHTLTHPKGKPYTFLEKDNKIFEINHLKEKYHSSFITSGEKTTSEFLSVENRGKLTRYNFSFESRTGFSNTIRCDVPFGTLSRNAF